MSVAYEAGSPIHGASRERVLVSGLGIRTQVRGKGEPWAGVDTKATVGILSRAVVHLAKLLDAKAPAEPLGPGATLDLSRLHPSQVCAARLVVEAFTEEGTERVTLFYAGGDGGGRLLAITEEPAVRNADGTELGRPSAGVLAADTDKPHAEPVNVGPIWQENAQALGHAFRRVFGEGWAVRKVDL